MNTLTATLKDGRRIPYLPDVIGEGGMKRVQFTADRKSVVCFYKDHTATTDPHRLARLEAILGRFNPTTDPTTGRSIADLFCWPTGLVVQPALGFVMPVYPTHFFFAAGHFKGKEKQLVWFTSPKLRRIMPAAERGDARSVLQMCARLSWAMGKLHCLGLAHADLSAKTILADPPKGRCIVIDIDSLVVPGLYAPDVCGTPGYSAPEVMATQHLPIDDPKRRSVSTLANLHTLAVIVYELLLRRHPLRGPRVNGQTVDEDERLSMGEKALFIEDPHDTSNRPAGMTVSCDQLGPSLARLFSQAFVDGLHNPQARPTADQWATGLCRSQDLLVPCANQTCEDQWFVYRPGAAPVCPRCGWKLDTPTPVLEFHDLRGNEQSQPESPCLVAWHQRTLHRWHVFGNVRPVEVEPDELAVIQFHQGQWLLVNKNLDSMVCPGGNPVPKGQACLLRNGAEVLLSKEEYGRRMRVRMIS